MNTESELLQKYLKCPAGHYKDGAGKTGCMSDDVLLGFMDGSKDAGKDESFGSVGDTSNNRMFNTIFHEKFFKKLVFRQKTGVRL